MSDLPENSPKQQIEKEIKLGLQYGMGPLELMKKIAGQAGITAESAKAYFENFKAENPDFFKNLKAPVTPGVLHILKSQFKAALDAGVGKESMFKLLEKNCLGKDQVEYAYDDWLQGDGLPLAKKDKKGLDLVQFAISQSLTSMNSSLDKLVTLVPGYPEPIPSMLMEQKVEGGYASGPIANGEQQKEEHSFDLNQFMPSLSVKQTVKSSGSENVYTVIAHKNGSRIAVSVTLAPEAGKLCLFIRFLEVPDGVGSQFENPGQTRPYLVEGEKTDVYMLTKFVMPLCSVRVSAWEVRSHLEAGVKDQVIAFIWRLLEQSGCAIDCKTDQEMMSDLFIRLDQLPETPELYWQNLDENSPGKL
jgi:hypothetical protein